MGLLFYDAKRLWEARQAGVSFDNVVTCSHQQLYLQPSELDQLRSEYRAGNGDRLDVPLAGYTFGGYAGQFFEEFLQVKSLEILDYSDYEGASIVHDMNLPIPASLFGRFDAVIEAGSLEHIFNFPVAISNLMRMAKVGGHLFLTTPANNFCGHGFYQFSPELIFRIFSPENGFEAARVVFLDVQFPGAELAAIRGAYQVTDPSSVRSRVGLVSDRPVLMLVSAKKVREVEPFATPPQQSDYVAAWKEKAVSQPHAGANTPVTRSVTRRLARHIYQSLPVNWQNWVEGHRQRKDYNLRNEHYYRKQS